MRARVCVVVAAALLVWGLKHHYATAQADDLWWVLTPTAALVETTTGAVFTATPGEGYFSRERLFLIEKSCAGINFMVAAFAMLVLTFFHRVATGTSASVVLGLSLVASYAAAVAVNTVRISIAMWLGPHPMGLVAVSATSAHRIQGIAVYFGGLLLLYEAASRADRAGRPPLFARLGLKAAVSRASRGAAVPLGAYYAVTLGIPLARGVVSLEARVVDHAVAVILVPLLIVALAGAFHRATRSDGVGGLKIFQRERSRATERLAPDRTRAMTRCSGAPDEPTDAHTRDLSALSRRRRWNRRTHSPPASTGPTGPRNAAAASASSG